MTFTDKQELIAFRDKGFAFSEIASIFGMDEALVTNIIKKHAPQLTNAGWEKKRNQKIDLPVIEIIHFRKQGWSKAQIASVYGVSSATIKSRIHEWSDANGENLSGYIPQTLEYPARAIEQLKSNGHTLMSIANKEADTSVVDIVRKLNNM